jgi:hypothetical protein
MTIDIVDEKMTEYTLAELPRSFREIQSLIGELAI